MSIFYYVREIVEGTAKCIIQNRSMALNTAAPRGVFPAVVLVRALIDLAPTMLVYFGVHILTGQPWGAVADPLPDRARAAHRLRARASGCSSRR